MKIYNVKGNTYYFETKFSYIPFYKINENEIIMLDSGYYDTDATVITDLIKQYKFTVRAVICTHAHVDHTGNNFYLKEKYNTEIIMPEYESMTCDSMYNVKAYNMPALPDRVVKTYGTIVCKTDRVISTEDEYVDVLGNKFQIVQLHGHTSYHIGIITPDGVFYVGDSILSKDVLDGTKIAYIADIYTYLETLEKLRKIKCDKYILAHKGILENIDDLNEVIDENLYYLENMMKLIIDIIDKPETISEVYKRIFKKLEVNKNVTTFFLAERMLLSYIYYLIDNGVIRMEIIDGMLKCCLNKHIAIG